MNRGQVLFSVMLFFCFVCLVIAINATNQTASNCNESLHVCTTDLEACNFELSKGVENYVKKIELVAQITHELDVVTAKYYQCTIMLENQKVKHPQEITNIP